jgi:putative FmdB family regulatory protein
MPTYAYSCTKCGEEFEVYQTFSDAPLKRHPGCGGSVQKVFAPVGIVLKGSGFYKNDSGSRSKSKSTSKSESSESKSETKSESSSKSDSSATKSDSKANGNGSSSKSDSKASKAAK